MKQLLRSLPAVSLTGRVAEISGPVVRVKISGAAVGDIVAIEARTGGRFKPSESALFQWPAGFNKESALLGEVVGFADTFTVISLFGDTAQIAPGAPVCSSALPLRIPVGAHLLGSAVNALGVPLMEEHKRTLPKETLRGILHLNNSPPAVLSRKPVSRIFSTGIRAIDGFLTLGFGQRIGIFAEPGVGKSSLLGMLLQHSPADVNVVGLIGERSREAQELVQRGYGAEKTVLVVSTSDEAAICRMHAASTAVRIAEYYRDQGKDVLLLLDSLTRLFRAYREVGLAAGEVPVRRGYPPSVFSRLPQLIERAGTGELGSITAAYTVLLSSDIDEDPMVEELKGLTDGHIVLNRSLAEAGRYPAIDVVRSLSRLHSRLISPAHAHAARRLRALLARAEADRDLIALGGTVDPELAHALEIEKSVAAFLAQAPGEKSLLPDTIERLVGIG